MAASGRVGDEPGGNSDVDALSRSRTEPASRVSRAAMLLAYRENPSFFAVARRLGAHNQTVQRCVERAVAMVRWRHSTTDRDQARSR